MTMTLEESIEFEKKNFRAGPGRKITFCRQQQARLHARTNKEIVASDSEHNTTRAKQTSSSRMTYNHGDDTQPANSRLFTNMNK